MVKKKAPDWKVIEVDYRAGMKTLRVIAAEHGITHGAVNKRAKQDGWDRDLSRKIRARAQTLVSKAAVSSQVSKENENIVVEVGAQLQKDVILAERQDVIDARQIVQGLLAELRGQNLSAADLKSLVECVETMDGDDDKAKLKLIDTLVKTLDLGNRADIAKKLAETLVKLIAAERLIFNITDSGPAGTIEDRMLKIAGEVA